MASLLEHWQDASASILTLHKIEVLRQINCQLHRLKNAERLRNGPVTQEDLERELNRVWSLIRPRPSHKVPSPFQNAATRLGTVFDQREMTAVTALLADLTQHVPWRLDFKAWWTAVGQMAVAERLQVPIHMNADRIRNELQPHN